VSRIQVAHRITYCPKQAVSDWLVAAAIDAGPVFVRLHRGDRVRASRLTDQSVALIIKGLAAKVGLDASRYAGHSLRSGFLTSAAQNWASTSKWPINPVINPWMCCESTFATKSASTIMRPMDCYRAPLKPLRRRRGRHQNRPELSFTTIAGGS
jgi:hypothetical protein